VANRNWEVEIEKQRQRRAYRKLLGLCADCTKRRTPGLTRCQKHHDLHMARIHTYNARQTKKRGWKMVKVKLR
jgi:hypothetical protein